MVPPKTWLAIPALALVCAGIGVAAREPVDVVIAIAALAAAIAAAVRAMVGPSLAVAIAAGASALLGCLSVLELPLAEPARVALACAAALFAIAELVRPLTAKSSPWPAVGGALVASVLDPSFVVLAPITGIRLVTGPWARPRWAFAVPALGILGTALAVFAATRTGGVFADLWTVWAARPPLASTPLAALVATGDLLGPVTAVVAAAGLAVCVVRGRLAAAATLGVLAGGLAVDLATASPGAATSVIAALGAGVGVARFAALVHWPAGQACVGAAVGFMLVVAPAWTLALG